MSLTSTTATSAVWLIPVFSSSSGSLWAKASRRRMPRLRHNSDRNHAETASTGSQAMDLRALRYFAHIAEARSFSKAAVQLRVAQPALSRQVQKLEDELG